MKMYLKFQGNQGKIDLEKHLIMMVIPRKLSPRISWAYTLLYTFLLSPILLYREHHT